MNTGTQTVITTTNMMAFQPRKTIYIGTNMTLWPTSTRTGLTFTTGIAMQMAKNAGRPTNRILMTTASGP
jgi:hypothetical protein